VTNHALGHFPQWAATAGAKCVAGDFNGDKKADISCVGPRGWRTLPVAFGRGNGQFYVTNHGIAHFASWATAPGAKFVAADFNGDGKTDAALVGGRGWRTIPVAFSNGKGGFGVTNQGLRNFPQWAATAGAQCAAGDFNGDKKADIACVGPRGWRTLPIAFGVSGSKKVSKKKTHCHRKRYSTPVTKCYNRKYAYRTRHPYKKKYNKCWNQVHRRWVNKPYPAYKTQCYNRRIRYQRRYPVRHCRSSKVNSRCRDGCTTTCHSTCSVTVYKHCNYGGYRINLKPGSYDMRTLMRKGMKNDDLSSIRVHGRCVARLYQHHHFGGKVLVKNRNDSCFTNDYMFPMSQLSQLVVHHADEKPELAQNEKAKKHDKPELDQVSAGWGRRRRARRTSWNDQISSIKVYGGRRCYRRCRRCRRRLACSTQWRTKWAHKTVRKCYRRRYIAIRRYLAHHTVRRCKHFYVTRYKWIKRTKTKRVCRRFYVTKYRKVCGGRKKRNPKTGKVCNSKAGAICHGYNLKCFRSSLSHCKKACKADKRCNLAEYKARSKTCCTSAIATKKQCRGRWAKANGWVGYNICR